MPDRLEKLAIIAPANSFSLGIVQCLSSTYRVELWSHDSEVVSAFRRSRPPIVIVIARFFEVGRGAGLARRLKTELRPPLVAMILKSGLPSEAEAFCRRYRLDGLLGGQAAKEEVLAFVNQIRKEESPVYGDPGRPNRVVGALERLSGWRVFSRDE